MCQCGRQRVIGIGQIAAFTQLVSLADAIEVEQVVETLASRRVQGPVLKIAQNLVDLGIFSGFKQDGGVLQDEIRRGRRGVLQLAAHEGQCASRFADVDIGRSQARCAIRTVVGHRLNTIEQGQGFLALSAFAQLYRLAELQVEADISGQRLHVRGALVGAQASQRCLCGFPLTHLDRQQGADVKRIGIGGMGLEHGVDQVPSLLRFAHRQVQAGQGETRPDVVRFVAQRVLQGVARSGQVVALFGEGGQLRRTQGLQACGLADLCLSGGWQAVDQLQGFIVLAALEQHVDQPFLCLRVVAAQVQYLAIVALSVIELTRAGLNIRQGEASVDPVRSQAQRLVYQGLCLG
ncbi:hypothetical protein D3C84_305210 [compost metagenome]